MQFPLSRYKKKLIRFHACIFHSNVLRLQLIAKCSSYCVKVKIFFIGISILLVAETLQKILKEGKIGSYVK